MAACLRNSLPLLGQPTGGRLRSPSVPCESAQALQAAVEAVRNAECVAYPPAGCGGPARLRARRRAGVTGRAPILMPRGRSASSIVLPRRQRHRRPGAHEHDLRALRTWHQPQPGRERQTRGPRHRPPSRRTRSSREANLNRHRVGGWSGLESEIGGAVCSRKRRLRVERGDPMLVIFNEDDLNQRQEKDLAARVYCPNMPR